MATVTQSSSKSGDFIRPPPKAPRALLISHAPRSLELPPPKQAPPAPPPKSTPSMAMQRIWPKEYEDVSKYTYFAGEYSEIKKEQKAGNTKLVALLEAKLRVLESIFEKKRDAWYKERRKRLEVKFKAELTQVSIEELEAMIWLGLLDEWA